MSESILQEAHRLTHGDRNKDYGPPLDDYTRTANLVSALLAHKLKEPLTASEMAMTMICVKLSRQVHSPKRDNMVDAAGYAWVAQDCIDETERRVKALLDSREPAPEPDPYKFPDSLIGVPGVPGIMTATEANIRGIAPAGPALILRLESEDPDQIGELTNEQDRAYQERCDASRPRQEAGHSNHAIGHQEGSSQGAVGRQESQLRPNGETSLQATWR